MRKARYIRERLPWSGVFHSQGIDAQIINDAYKQLPSDQQRLLFKLAEKLDIKGLGVKSTLEFIFKAFYYEEIDELAKRVNKHTTKGAIEGRQNEIQTGV